MGSNDKAKWVEPGSPNDTNDNSDSRNTAVGCLVIVVLLCGIAFSVNRGWILIGDTATVDPAPWNPPQSRVFDNREEVASECAQQLIARGETEMVKVEAGQLYTLISEKAGHNAVFFLPAYDEDAFHTWYRTSPKQEQFVDGLAANSRNTLTLVVRAPPNNLDVEWVTFQVDPASITAVSPNDPSLAPDSALPNESTSASGTDKRDELVAAGIVLTTMLIGKLIERELSARSDQVFVRGYYRADGTWVE